MAFPATLITFIKEPGASAPSGDCLMTLILKRFYIPVLLLLSLLAGPLPGWSAETPQVEMISRSDKVKTIEASVTIDAPPATVWSVLTDYANLKNVLPGYELSDVVARNAHGATVDLAVKASPMAPTFRYRVSIQENRPANTLTIKRISGDFNSILATYHVIPAAGGSKTNLTYRLNIDLGGKFALPGANHILKSSTEKSMAAMRKTCGASYRHSVTARR